MELKKEKNKSVINGRNRAVFTSNILRGLGAPVEFWSYRFSPKTYPGNDIQDAWSEVGGLLTEAMEDFDQKESA